jgi:hypothetical protein
MDELKGIIRDRFNQIGKYLEMVKKYFDRVKIIIEGTNITDYRNIIANIEFINKFITTDVNLMYTGDNMGKIIAINNFWNDLQKLYNAMAEFDAILLAEKYAEKIIFTMSQSGGMEFKLLRAGIFNTHERLINEIRDIDNKFFNEIIPQLDRSSCIEFLLSDNTVNAFTTSLMFYLMKTGNENERSRLKRLIEGRKDAVLDVKRKILSGSGNSLESMPLLYGLVPACQVMNIGELLREIGFSSGGFTTRAGGAKSKKEYNVVRVSKTMADIPMAKMQPTSALIHPKQTSVYARKGVTFNNIDDLTATLENIIHNGKDEFGFIVLNRGSKSIIEFDIRGLISTSYVSSLVTNPNFGLNKKFIKRFSTVTHHPENPGGEIWANIPIGAKYTYIIDLFTDEESHLLGRMLSLELGKYKTPIDAIPGLTVGITSRPYQYNKIISDKIISEYHDPLAEGIIGTLGEIKSGKSSEAIKNKIINAFLEHYDDSMPNTYDDFKALFTSWGALDSVLIGAMMHIVHKQPTPEMLLTYLVKIDDVSKMFNAELELAFKDARVSLEMFTQLNKEDLRKQLRDITRQIVTTAANQLDQGNQWTKHSLSLKEHFIDKKFENI